MACLVRLLCACSFYQSALSLEVQLPAAPEHWQEAFPELDYRLVHLAPEGGGFEERRIDSDTHAVIRIPKLLYIPVLAYPVPACAELAGKTIELPPAGGVYPLDCEFTAAKIGLSWQGGASAEVLHRLWKQGVDCSVLNVPRLIREMSAQHRGDPWSLDLDRICDRLASGSFRLTDIRPAPCRDLRLEPGQGHWSLESPFRSPVPAQADGSLLLEAVPPGGHTLFEISGADCFFLYVGEEAVLLTRG